MPIRIYSDKGVPGPSRVLEASVKAVMLALALLVLFALGYWFYIVRVLNPQLQRALDEWDAPVVYRLIRLGASDRIRSSKGVEPLVVGAQCGHVPLIKELLARGIQVDRRSYHMTPLIGASCTGKLESVRTLIESGADIEARDESGGTALMYAAANGYADIVGILLGASAKVDAKDDDGNTALVYAAGTIQGQESELVVRLLLKYGADRTAGRPAGKRPVNLAAKKGHAALVSILRLPPERLRR